MDWGNYFTYYPSRGMISSDAKRLLNTCRGRASSPSSLCSVRVLRRARGIGLDPEVDFHVAFWI